MPQYLADYRSRPFTYHYGGGSYDPRYAVFKGERYQYGNGLGDILRGVGRFILPWVTRAASSFIGNLSENIQSGKDFKNAAIGAASHTLSDTAEQAKEKIMARFQGGSGLRKRKHHKSRSHSNKKRRTSSKRATKKRVYKKRKRHTKKVNTNF
jgi:hypothetical protein